MGCDRELTLLEGLYTGCVDESVARAALVTAPAGAGKSEGARQRVTEFLGELVRTPFPDEARPSLAPGPGARGADGRGDAPRLRGPRLASACADAPLVIVVEDVHWSDGASVKYLDAVL
ncbi:hypothetical protein [Sorangium sp. So ce1099]|uniref:hypothetical protein n=1 Tax=Sorangium sp. So ce1099 TaxID=3133331 RepID=UPI003F63EC9B